MKKWKFLSFQLTVEEKKIQSVQKISLLVVLNFSMYVYSIIISTFRHFCILDIFEFCFFSDKNVSHMNRKSFLLTPFLQIYISSIYHSIFLSCIYKYENNSIHNGRNEILFVCIINTYICIVYVYVYLSTYLSIYIYIFQKNVY